MARKLDVSIVADFTLRIEGNWLVMEYRNEEIERKNLKCYPRIYRDLETFRGESEGEKSKGEIGKIGIEGVAIESETTKFMETYKAIIYKFTRKHVTYTKSSKAWAAFEKASVQARHFGIDYYTYIITIKNHYSTMNREMKPVMPFPNQLYGEMAQTIIMNDAASRSTVVDDDMVARKKAIIKKNVSLDNDEEYLAARARLKSQKFTRADLEYVRLRITQVKGHKPDWVERYEKILEDRENAQEKEE